MVCIGEFADKLGINTPPKNVSWPCDTIQDYRPAPTHCCLWVTGTFAPLDSLYPHINRVFFFFTRWKKKLTNTTCGCHVEKTREPQLPFPSKGWASSEQAFRVSAQKAMNTLSTWFWGGTMIMRSRHLARIIGLPVLRSILKQKRR